MPVIDIEKLEQILLALIAATKAHELIWAAGHDGYYSAEWENAGVLAVQVETSGMTVAHMNRRGEFVFYVSTTTHETLGEAIRELAQIAVNAAKGKR